MCAHCLGFSAFNRCRLFSPFLHSGCVDAFWMLRYFLLFSFAVHFFSFSLRHSFEHSTNVCNEHGLETIQSNLEAIKNLDSNDIHKKTTQVHLSYVYTRAVETLNLIKQECEFYTIKSKKSLRSQKGRICFYRSWISITVFFHSLFSKTFTCHVNE